jgi:hypothetical protein
MTTTAKFRALIKSSYIPQVVKSLKFLGVILVGLNLVLSVTIFEDVTIFLDFVLASLILFVGIAMLPPALLIGFTTLKVAFTAVKKVFIALWKVPTEVGKMTSFQRYLLVLVTVLVGVILVSLIKK